MGLDWSKIDHWQKFQRLVNALFCSEINDSGFFQPSNPYIGADGGWDGRYSGKYPPEGIVGLFSIQSKSTTKEYKAAVDWLKGELLGGADEIGEIKKAEKNNVEHLRIATNAELKIDQVDELEKLVERTKLKSLKIWYREQLSQRIIREPFIRYYFFDNPQISAFIPADIYFTEIEKTLQNFLTSIFQGLLTTFLNFKIL
ncbi:MAG: hypothetical protein ABSB78_08790 [Bacteroidota bacterium]